MKKPKQNKQQDREPLDEGALAPASVDAERAILGAVLLDNSCYPQAAASLQPHDFSLSSHETIWEACVDLVEHGKSVDYVTLIELLTIWRKVEFVGGVAYVTSLTDGLPRVKNISQYVAIVAERARGRMLIRALTSAISDAALLAPSGQVIGEIEQELMAITQHAKNDSCVHISDAIQPLFAELMATRASNQEIVGIPSGIQGLDFNLGGFRRGENVVVAGWTGGGKTAFGLNVAQENCQRHDKMVSIFSYEMRREELLLRLASSVSGINHLKLRHAARLTDQEIERLADAFTEIKKWKLYVDDAPGHLSELTARMRMQAARGCDLNVVDYLQRIPAPGDNLRERVSNASGGLTEVTKQTRVPLLNLSQLSRPERGGNKKPALHDLKESGNIEQDAHTVLLLYCPVTSNGEPTHEDEIILAKQRNGPTGYVPAYFRGKTMQWCDRDESARDQNSEQQNLLGE